MTGNLQGWKQEFSTSNGEEAALWPRQVSEKASLGAAAESSTDKMPWGQGRCSRGFPDARGECESQKNPKASGCHGKVCSPQDSDQNPKKTIQVQRQRKNNLKPHFSN